jgi:serine/threonine protein phosphatase PrpC
MMQTSQRLTQRPHRVFMCSDRGAVRQVNEDALWMSPDRIPASLAASHGWVYVVSDGMGGHAGGEMASRIVAETFGQTYYAAKMPSLSDRVLYALRCAHSAVQEQKNRYPQFAEMGATIVVLIVLNSQAWVMNVGDSRAYLFRDKTLRQLTDDHSIVAEGVRSGILTSEEARQSSLKNLLTRVVGGAGEAQQPSMVSFTLSAGDRILLCTDGIWGEISDTHITAMLGCRRTEDAVSALMSAAVHSNDNISAMVVDTTSRRVRLSAIAWMGASVLGALAVFFIAWITFFDGRFSAYLSPFSVITDQLTKLSLRPLRTTPMLLVVSPLEEISTGSTLPTSSTIPLPKAAAIDKDMNKATPTLVPTATPSSLRLEICSSPYSDSDCDNQFSRVSALYVKWNLDSSIAESGDEVSLIVEYVDSPSVSMVGNEYKLCLDTEGFPEEACLVKDFDDDNCILDDRLWCQYRDFTAAGAIFKKMNGEKYILGGTYRAVVVIMNRAGKKIFDQKKFTVSP